MKHFFLILLTLTLHCFSVSAQEKNTDESAIVESDSLFTNDYPEGIYQTKADFVAKKPSDLSPLTPKGLVGFKKPVLTTVEHNCFFYYTQTDKKLKDVFAVSYKGNLYFQISAIVDNIGNDDQAQENTSPNSFVRVISGGSDFLYTEAEFANKWATGAAYGAGGASGHAIAQTVTHGKGVIYDFMKRGFNIFKNCKDYNEFIRYIYPEGVQECKNHQADILQVRKDFEKIKTRRN